MATASTACILDAANGPVDVTASAPDHISDTEAGVVIAGENNHGGLISVWYWKRHVRL